MLCPDHSIATDSVDFLDRKPAKVKLAGFGFALTDVLMAPSRTGLIIAEIIICLFSFQIGARLGPYANNWDAFSAQSVSMSLVFAVSFSMAAIGMGSYERLRRFSFGKVFGIWLLATLFALPLCLTVNYFAFYQPTGRLTLVYGALVSVVALALFRFLLATIYRFLPYRFTLLGDSEISRELAEYFSKSKRGIHRSFSLIPSQQFHGTDGQLDLRLIGAARVNDLVFSLDMFDDPKATDIAVNALKNGHRVFNEVDFYSTVFEALPIRGISKSWLACKGLNTRNLAYLLSKRILDIALSGLLIVVLFPLMATIALAIKMTSPGPIIFVQPRQGRFNVPFSMYKFRTMHAAMSSRSAAGGFTKARDSRLTGVGKIIRPLHLDELPQLVNIFLGVMSLVGPRPEALAFAQRMNREIPLYDLRYLMRPGLTGHAQIMAGYMMDDVPSAEKKLAYDLFYLTHQSALFDIRILIRTIFVVLGRLFRS